MGRKLVAFIFGTLSAVVTASVALAASDSPCIRGETLRLRFHEYTIELLRGYRPYLYGDSVPRGSAGQICQGPNDPLIEVPEFSVWFRDPNFPHDEFTEPLKSLQLIVSKSPIPESEFAGFAVRAQQVLKSRGLSPVNLPQADGFYVLESPEKSYREFIAISPVATTPRGYPLTYRCSRSVTTTFTGEVIGHTCKMIYLWSGKYIIEYRFRDERLPPNRWLATDAALRRFLNHIGMHEESGAAESGSGTRQD